VGQTDPLSALGAADLNNNFESASLRSVGSRFPPERMKSRSAASSPIAKSLFFSSMIYNPEGPTSQVSAQKHSAA
jgi:hypothetical protein